MIEVLLKIRDGITKDEILIYCTLQVDLNSLKDLLVLQL